MATRLQLPHLVGSEAAAVSPAYDAGWDDTTGATRIRLRERKWGTVRSSMTAVTIGTVSGNDTLFVQFVTDPLAAQTLAGTVTAVLPVRESSLNSNARAQMSVRVVSNDGTTVRGTLLDLYTGALTNEFTNASGLLPGVNYPQGHANNTLTPVDVQDGDRLVIGMGCRQHAGTGGTITYQLGDGNATDMLTDESTTTGSPWIEFSQTLVWARQYTYTSYSADHTALGGNLGTAISNAGDVDVLYLSAGAWKPTGSSLGTDTSRTKVMRVKPAEGLAQEDVEIGDGITSVTLTNSHRLSFENVTFPRSCFFEGQQVGFVGCRIWKGLQLTGNMNRIWVHGCTIGGDRTAEVFTTTQPDAPTGYSNSGGIFFGLLTGEWAEDISIVNNDIGFVWGRDLIEMRFYRNVTIDNNNFHNLVQGDIPDDHTDVCRAYLGGKGLRFTNNFEHNNNHGQGLYCNTDNGNSDDDWYVANNIFGQCKGTFRCFAIDNRMTHLRVVNNTFHDAGSFSQAGTNVTGVIWFNNLNTNAAGLTINLSSAVVTDFHHDYNVFGGGTTNFSPTGSDTETVPTLVDQAGDDFRITSGSASGINLGVESFCGVYAPTTDMNGDPRTFPCEAGALEGVV